MYAFYRHSVDGLVVNPVREQLGDLLALPLRSHVAGTVNSCEIETAFVVDEVARYLSISVPRSPGSLDVEVQAVDPAASALSWHGTIGIS